MPYTHRRTRRTFHEFLKTFHEFPKTFHELPRTSMGS